jgi:Tfp pilus assembly protein PilF
MNYLATHDYNQAEAAYRAMLVWAPNSPTAHSGLADAFYGRKELDKAIAEARRNHDGNTAETMSCYNNGRKPPDAMLQRRAS